MTTLGQGKKMTLTFNTHVPSYIQLDDCSYLLSGHWLQYFLKNQLFLLFPIEKPKLPNLPLPLNRSRSLEGHHLNKLSWAGVPNTTYQVSWKSAHRFRRRFLKGFTIYGRGGHLGHVTSIMSSDFHFLVPESFHKKIWFRSAQ